MSKLEELIGRDIAIIKSNKLDEYELDKMNKTVILMEKVEKKIREYITSSLEIVLSLYITFFIIVLIEPIEIKQYYLFFVYVIINSFFLYNITHSNKNLTGKYDEIVPEYNRVLDKFIEDEKNIEIK